MAFDSYSVDDRVDLDGIDVLRPHPSSDDNVVTAPRSENEHVIEVFYMGRGDPKVLVSQSYELIRLPSVEIKHNLV